MECTGTDDTQPTLAAAINANLYTYFHELGRSPQAEIFESPAMIRWHTRVAHPWFNGVLSLRNAADEAETIQATLAFFSARKIASFSWWLAPALPVAAWTAQLVPRGFRYDDRTPGMAVALASVPQSVPQPAALSIRPVEDRATFKVWARTFIRGYNLPESVAGPFWELIAGLGYHESFRYYLGLHNNRPVATSMLFLAAGVTGIHDVATVAEARGQGIGGAMTLYPLQAARDLGYRTGVLQSSDMGFGVYRRLGFEQLCALEHFVGNTRLPGARPAS